MIPCASIDASVVVKWLVPDTAGEHDVRAALGVLDAIAPTLARGSGRSHGTARDTLYHAVARCEPDAVCVTADGDTLVIDGGYSIF